MFHIDFQSRCPGKDPAEFGHFLLELADRVEDEVKARDVFYKAVRVSFAENREDEPTIEELHSYVEKRPRMADAWESVRSCRLHLRTESEVRSRQAQRKQEEAEKENLRQIQVRTERIARGEDLAALIWLAEAYYNISYHNVSHMHRRDLRQLSPVNRLVERLNPDLAKVAIRGFVASAVRPDLPTPAEVGKASAQNRGYSSCFPARAGMDLRWKNDPEDFRRLPSKILARALVYYLACPAPEQDCEHGWCQVVINDYPEESTDALIEFWQPSLEQKIDNVTGLDRLEGWPDVGRLASTQLLNACPRTHPKSLEQLLIASLVHGDRASVLGLARQQIEKPQGLRTEQFLLWLGTAFLLDPKSFASKVLQHAPRRLRRNSELKRASVLRDCFARTSRACKDLWEQLPLSAIETTVLAFTRAYPHWPDFDGEGNYDKVYVPEWVQDRLDWLGNRTEDEARDALMRLRDHRDMAPWRDRIRHTLEIQVRKRREAEFRQPSFAKVVETLKGGRPANAADLFALVRDHLEQLADEIRNASSDGYKTFWNLDPHQKPEKPLPEETCRDRLKERLEQPLAVLDISVERESDHADHKRADLRVSFGDIGIPVECKRHDNRELWVGIENQLIPRYMRDPSASGYGVYLVFWFGLDAKKFGASPPQGVAKPTSSEELEAALRDLVPEDHRNRIAVICVDVSRPEV